MSSAERAPGGAFSAGTSEPAIELRVPPQGSIETVDASVTRISRMMKQIFHNELAVRRWEATASRKGRRFVKAEDGTIKLTTNADLVVEPLRKAREKRDEHLKELRHIIDYALTTGAYEDSPCPECSLSLPQSPLDFIRAVPTAELRTSRKLCKTCKGRGAVRVKKDDPESKEAFKRISYFKKVLDDTIRCAKVRYSLVEADQAYRELESSNQKILRKLGNEAKTSLEGEDAVQGVRQGFIDAAVRFDPTRESMASFGTVAYNWCYRNSRARQPGQKRAGVYAMSIESMDRPDKDGAPVVSQIVSSEGAFGSFSGGESDPNLALDLKEKIAALTQDQRDVIMSIMNGHSSVSKDGDVVVNVAAIARELGKSKEEVRRLRDTAFARLRDSLGGYVEVLRD